MSSFWGVLYFNASGSNAGSGSITAYEWRSNGTLINTASSFTYPFGTPSNDITLKITNSSGQTNTASAKVIVQIVAAPTITLISPSSVQLKQPTTLTVNGTNLLNITKIQVTTPLGVFPPNNASLPINIVNAGQLTTSVNMDGTPSYTASLVLTNSQGQVTAYPFQVVLTNSATPTIANITPNSIPFEQEIELTVNGSNFQSDFTATVFSPAGKVGGDIIDSSGLRFINSNQVRVKVTMRGTPTYTARLAITVNGKSAESTFQVFKPIANNPVFTIVPSQGARGTTFTNSGKQFKPNQKVIVKVEWADGTSRDNIIRQADANGIIAGWNYPSLLTDPLGIHTLKVRDYETQSPITTAQVNYTPTANGDVASVLNNGQNQQANPPKQVTVNWNIKNIGTTTFDSNYKIVRVDSTAALKTTTGGSSFPFLGNGTAGAGTTISINLNFVSPSTPGTYPTIWQLQNPAGQNFGPPLTAQIIVIASNKSKTGSGTQASNGTGDSNNSKANYNSDPVNTANGNYVYDREDLRVPSRGLDFVFSRFYNSLDITPSTLGNGWSHSFNVSLGDLNTNNPVVRYSDGKVLEYESETDVTNTYRSRVPGFYDKLVKNPEGTWSLLKSDQRNYNFDAAGKLVAIQDRNGNYLALSYDGNGLLQEVTDTASRRYSFGYNGQKLATLTDPSSRTMAFGYDAAGNLSSFKDANGNTMQYFYDANNRIIRIVDGRTNNVLVNDYDEVGRVKTQTNGHGYKWQFSYNPDMGVTTITDPLSQTVKDHHDTYFNLKTATNTQSKIAEIGYDTNGNRNQAMDLNGSAQNFAYDSRGNLISSVNPNQNARQIQYDLKNNPMMVMDELNRATTMEYDQKGNLMMLKDAMQQAVQMTYNQYGQPETITDPNGNQTRLTYDNQGNLRTSTNALSQTTTFEYDAVGRRTKVTDARGKSASFVYDYNDNVVSVTDASSKTTNYKYDANDNLIEATDPRGKTTKYEYNENNLLIKETDAYSKTILHTYDELDRRITTTDKRGNVTQFGYDSEGRLLSVKDPNNNVTQFAYDANGNRTKVIDPSGQATEFTYDPLNRLIQSKDPLGNTVKQNYDVASQLKEGIDQRELSTRFDYDDVGNLKQVTDAAQGKVTYAYDKNRNRISVTDPNNNTSKTTYDKLNRVETTEDPLGNKYLYTYDEVGNRKTMTDAKKQLIKYDYDNNNRLTTITYPDNSTVTFTYDENGNVLEMKDALGTTKYVYDDLNRITTYTDAYGKTIGYEYDENGNIKTLIYPDGKRVAYEFDKGNRMISVTDWLSKVTRYDYDERNLVKKATNGNGTTATYSYDIAGRLLGLVNAKSDNTIISSYAYELDRNGNRLKATIQEPIPPTVGIAPQTATFDEANRIKTAGTSSFTFDANGNMTGKMTRGITTAFNWDFNDRLTAVGITTSYFYNGVGTRLAKREGATTTRYVVDVNRELSQVLCETDGSGSITSYYIYGLGLLSQIGANGKKYDYHYDLIGSTVAITSESQQLINSYSYDSNGKLASGKEGIPNTFKFVGSQGLTDEGNGFLYVRARYYHFDSSRFLTKDPVDSVNNDGTDTQEINQYVYAKNNPILFTDTNGKWINIALGAIGGAAAGFATEYIGQTIDHIKSDHNQGGISISTFTKGYDGKKIAGSTVGGAVMGGCLATGVGLLISSGCGAAGSLAGSLTEHIAKGNLTLKETIYDTVAGGVTGAIGYGIGKGIEKLARPVGKPAEKFVTKYITGKNIPYYIGKKVLTKGIEAGASYIVDIIKDAFQIKSAKAAELIIANTRKVNK